MLANNKRECLYRCGSGALSTQKYHVYPVSASTISLTLPNGIVCDKCNAYFSKLEQYFTERHPGTAERLVKVKETRKGKAPCLFTAAGKASRTTDKDNVTVFEIPLSDFAFKFTPSGDIELTGRSVLLPFESRRISRLLAKIACEAAIGFQNGIDPYSEQMAPLRQYARFGSGAFVWFAYRFGAVEQVPPQLIRISDRDRKCTGMLCSITFPKVLYAIPYPPFGGPEMIGAVENWKEEGWNVITKDQVVDNVPLETTATLKRVTNETEGCDRKFDSRDR